MVENNAGNWTERQITLDLAQFIVDTRYEDLPAPVV